MMMNSLRPSADSAPNYKLRRKVVAGLSVLGAGSVWLGLDLGLEWLTPPKQSADCTSVGNAPAVRNIGETVREITESKGDTHDSIDVTKANHVEETGDDSVYSGEPIDVILCDADAEAQEIARNNALVAREARLIPDGN